MNNYTNRKLGLVGISTGTVLQQKCLSEKKSCLNYWGWYDSFVHHTAFSKVEFIAFDLHIQWMCHDQ